MNLKIVIIVLSLCLFNNLISQTPATDPHWQLFWSDDFNSLDLSKWAIANNYDHGGEPQMYRTNNVNVLNGNLTLTVKSELYLGHSYTSGWIESQQAINTQYGYIEARINVPYGYGFWPAFWTFVGPGLSNFSNAAEIDIFELYGNKPANNYETNVHLDYCPAPPLICTLPDYLGIHTLNYFYNDNNFHIYAIDWSPTKIIWYVDGIPIRSLENPGVIDPVRIIFNIAITSNSLPNSSTPLPSSMLIDYIKIYQLKKDCNTIINQCNYNFSNT